jgi:hypothetical protein
MGIAVLAVGCGGSDEADVKDGLAKLPFDVEYRDTNVPEGAEGVVAGRATDTDGVTVDFAVTIADDPKSSVEAVEVPGGGSQGYYHDNGAGFYYNSNGYPHFHPKDSALQEKQRREMKFAIEGAACQAILGHSCGP